MTEDIDNVKYEAYYSTNVEEDYKLYLAQFESVRDFYEYRGAEALLSHFKDDNGFWRLHLVVYND